MKRISIPFIKDHCAGHHDLIHMSMVASSAYLALGILNQSAIPPLVQARGWTVYIGAVYATFAITETGSVDDRSTWARPCWRAARHSCGRWYTASG